MFGSDATNGHVVAPDGTPIAWFREAFVPTDAGDASSVSATRPPLLLVHGTTADHTTFRALGPRMAASRTVISIDRRGRGGSGDALPYSMEREFDDVAAVADALASATGQRVDAFGHSFGGRCVLGAALLTDSIRRVVAYEGAVRPAVGGRDPDLMDRLDRLLAEGRNAEMLEVFLRRAVAFTDDEWEAFRTSPTFAARVAAADTVPRELRAGAAGGAELERYVSVRQPVLLVIGSESPPFFADGARELARRLPNGSVSVIEGARHRAHHTHLDALVDLIERFLDQRAG